MTLGVDMERRAFMLIATVLMSRLPNGSCCWAADTEARVQFIWNVPSDRIDVAKEYLGGQLNEKVDETSIESERGLPLLLIISAVVLLPQLAEAVVRVYRGYEYGGVLITSEDQNLRITTDRRLAPGMVIVKSGQGVTVYQARNPSGDELLTPIKSILQKK